VAADDQTSAVLGFAALAALLLGFAGRGWRRRQLWLGLYVVLALGPLVLVTAWPGSVELAEVDKVVARVGIAGLATLLIGLVLRGHLGRCVSFSIYVFAVLAPSLLMTLWPARFYRWEFYSMQEALHAVIKFAIALELTARVFALFPGAIATARKAILTVLSLTLLAVLALPTWQPEYHVVLGEIQPRILNGTTWLLTAIASLVLWYRIPIHPFHKAILLGLTPYLLVFTVGVNAIETLGWGHPLSRAHTVAYCLLLLYWNHVAWARSETRGPAGQRPTAATRPETGRG
jgi:hypothetical protein